LPLKLPSGKQVYKQAVYKQAVGYLDKNNLLYENQSEFWKVYSKDSCLIDLTDQMKLDMFKELYVGMVLTDL